VTPFQPIGSVDSARLKGPRIALQWALQIPAAAGRHLQGGEERYGLSWDAQVGALTTAPIPAARGKRFGLKVADLAVVCADDDGGYEALSLEAKTLADGLTWVGERVGEPQLGRPNHVLPSHAVVRGGLFIDDDRGALGELERWVINAFTLLPKVAGAHAVSCSPRTFAVVCALEGDLYAGAAIGDRDRPAPYWFVRPARAPPFAASSDAPAGTIDGGGRWHREGWFGAILPGEELEPAEGEGGQENQVSAFLKSAVERMR